MQKSKMLSDLEIRKIRQMRIEDPEKWTVRALAKEFGVGKSLIGALINAHREDTSFKRLGRRCQTHDRVMEFVDGILTCPVCADKRSRFEKMKF